MEVTFEVLFIGSEETRTEVVGRTFDSSDWQDWRDIEAAICREADLMGAEGVYNNWAVGGHLNNVSKRFLIN
jgi:hypothetical protein